MKDINLDDLLLRLGDSGKFQRQYYTLLCCVVIFSVFHMSYIFTARDIKYRCRIEECENNTASEYKPSWLQNAVPFNDDTPNRCLRYLSKAEITCTNFDRNNTIACADFIYERPETTIVHDFGIWCDENLWKLTIVGTISVAGQLFCLPFSGFLSDRFGRKTMMVTSVLLSTTVGTLRSFSVNYYMYVICEFIDTALGSGMYSGAFILAMELVSPKSRNIGNTILSCAFVSGQILMGVVAWLAPSWRVMLRILYVPGLLYIALWWLVPESVRWLLSKGKQDEARQILRNVAKKNKIEICFESLEKFVVPKRAIKEDIKDGNREENKTESFVQAETLINSLKSLTLVLRVLQCSYLWICCTFIYYGLTIHSVTLADNIYVSFLLAVTIEAPAYITCYFVMERVGRKKLICSTLLLAGAACVSLGYMPLDIPAITTTLFLLGKFCLTLAYSVVYVYTTEMFPTSSRHSMFALCSMFGRLGSMIAPQVPILARISKSLPMIMFGVMAATSGLLALSFPETLNTELPDTVHDAVHIGKSKRQRQQQSQAAEA